MSKEKVTTTVIDYKDTKALIFTIGKDGVTSYGFSIFGAMNGTRLKTLVEAIEDAKAQIDSRREVEFYDSLSQYKERENELMNAGYDKFQRLKILSKEFSE